jgi:hypothetical protein
MIDDTLRGYQIAVVHRVGTAEHWDVYDNVPDDVAGALMRYWRRLAWLRFGALTMEDAHGDELVVRWRDVLDIRVQPQREVIE